MVSTSPSKQSWEKQLKSFEKIATEFSGQKDYLQIATKPNIAQLLGLKENICFSSKIKKINLHGWG